MKNSRSIMWFKPTLSLFSAWLARGKWLMKRARLSAWLVVFSTHQYRSLRLANRCKASTSPGV
ncbi:hypothetical protein D3C84_1101680 [compost metagenome]